MGQYYLTNVIIPLKVCFTPTTRGHIGHTQVVHNHYSIKNIVNSDITFHITNTYIGTQLGKENTMVLANEREFPCFTAASNCD